MYGIVADISGDSVSFGTAVPIAASGAFGNRLRGQHYYGANDAKNGTDTAAQGIPLACEFSPDNNKICVVFEDNNSPFSTNSQISDHNGSVWVCTATIDNSDNSVTFTEPDLLYPDWIWHDDNCMAYDTENNRMVFFFIDRLTDSIQLAIADGSVSTGFDNGYLDKFIGFAGTGTGTGSRYDDGDTVTVSVAGHLNESQSSLTVGQTYYLKGNGYLTNNLVESTQAYRAWAGTATAATKLAVKGYVELPATVGQPVGYRT